MVPKPRRDDSQQIQCIETGGISTKDKLAKPFSGSKVFFFVRCNRLPYRLRDTQPYITLDPA